MAYPTSDTPTSWMLETFEPDLASVIIPTFDRAHLIARALDSIRDQDYRPIEIIVIDDGSADNTGQVVANWKAKNVGEGLTLKYLWQANSGAPSARNTGLCASSGEYIQFFDSDDMLVCNKLAEQVTALSSDPRAAIVWSAMKSMRYDNVLFSRPAQTLAFARSQPENIPASVVRCLFRRDLCVRVGPWDPALKRYQDWQYSVRCTALAPICLANAAIMYWVISHDGPRIDNEDDSLAGLGQRSMQAVSAALAAKGCRDSVPARTRIGRKALTVFLVSLKQNDMDHASAVLSIVRKTLALTKGSRLKAEALYVAMHFCSRRLRSQVISRLLH